MPSRIIPTLHRPSPAAFRSHLLSSTPLKLTGAIDHFPALTSWTLPNRLGKLRSLAEGATVSLEWGQKGRGYMSHAEAGGTGQGGRGKMPLDVFLDAFILKTIPSSSPSSLSTSSSDAPIFYAAQNDLLTSIPSLSFDLPPFLEPYLAAGKGESWRSNIWIGPSGTFTPIHRDPYHNVFCQIQSSKTLTLYPPSTPSRSFYLAPPPQQQTSTLPTSPSTTCLASYPLFAIARDDYEHVVTVEKGECLLIPEGWWHAVEGNDGEGKEEDDGEMRISVNFWFR